ncbi:hypothetical protein BJX99DRAFT_50697 [Aspergillus californicus]
MTTPITILGGLSSPLLHDSSNDGPQTISTPENHEQPETETHIFERLSAYPFALNREFAQGLAIIFGHPETPPSEEEICSNDDLVLKAKCYYFAREEKIASPVNVTAYKAWLDKRSIPDYLTGRPPVTNPGGAKLPTTSLQVSSKKQHSSPVSQEPAYPTSFAHIVDLITTGQPIPGIQNIPDTLLINQGAPSVIPSRRKPWEKDESVEAS